MLPKWLTALLVMLHEMWSTRRDAPIRFLKLQVEMFRARLPGNRVIFDPVERQRLMKIGAEVGHAVEHTLEIVSAKTYHRWQCEERGGQELGKVGRLRLTKSVCELILRLARENVGWGVRRIVGELKKLALRPSRSSVRRLLVDEKILPDPERRAPKGVQTPWRKFIAVHMNVMVACDFFCKTIWTPLGKHPRVHIHFIPTSSSWLNMVERWFRDITDKRIRRGVFTSVPRLVEAIMGYIANHNTNPKAYTWTAKADEILAKVERARAVLNNVQSD